MLQLLSPAGLWTLAALALPLAIHLWRPPPMTVRLGSLRFLDNLPHRRLRNLRWRERALLAVRLALLAALALLVAGPHWRAKPLTGPQRWVLLDPTAALSGQPATRLRQLRANGYAVHRLAPGLPMFDPASRADAPGEPVTPPDLWPLLLEADAALPAGSTLAVFTPGRLMALHGARPALRHCRVEWITTPDAAGIAAPSWIESFHSLAATDGQPGAAQAVVGASGAPSTAFATVLFPPAPGAAAAPAVEFSPDGSRARLAGASPGPWMEAAKAPAALRVLILHAADRAGDARSVEAAVRAVAAVTGERLDMTVRPLDGPAPPTADDWVFWLGTQPVPDALADATPNLVTDAGTDARGLPATVEGWIVAPPGTPGAATLSALAVPLWRRTPAPLASASPDETLWTDSRGEPLLTLARTAHGRRWKFYSRFDPDWNDLPRTAVLAAFLRDLLLPPPSTVPTDPARDRRLADPSQYSLSLSLAPTPVRSPAPAAAPDGVDLHWPLWLLAAILFAAERVLSRRTVHRSFNVPAAVPVAVASR